MTVEWLKVTATCCQEITIGTGATRAFMTATNDVIPGSAVRGALARAWRFAHGDGHPLFRGVFDGAVRFGPLRVQGSAIASQSVWGCKYHSKDSGEPRYIDAAFACPHCGAEGISDPCTACGKSQATPPAMCGRPGEALKGTVMFAAQTKKVVASTAIHPENMTALESSLFAREVFPKGTVFEGYIAGDSKLNPELRKFKRVALGGRKSVLGAVELTLDTADPPKLPETSGTVLLRTTSPTLLVDAAGAPSDDVAAAFPAARVERVWGGRLTIDGTSGWHAASRLPKPGDLALAPGVVVALSGLDRAKLRRILDKGIGVRRPEGFGWLEVVDSPWQPPQQAAGEDSASPVTTTPDLGLLTPRELKWLAGWLRTPRDWGEQHFETLWTTAAGKNLNGQKQQIVRTVLGGTPAGSRAALASELERS